MAKVLKCKVCDVEVTAVAHETSFLIVNGGRVPGFFTVRFSCGCEYLDVRFESEADHEADVMRVEYHDSIMDELVLVLEEPLSEYD